MCYIDDMKDIVTSWTDFENHMEDKNLVYVDKTEYVYRMARKRGGFYYISRPRRFGKSLMCSTLDALFSGKRELFDGLWISNTDYDFKAYPVLRFDFSMPSTSNYKGFLNGFRMQLHANALRNKVSIHDAEPADMMNELLSLLSEPVVIIDEFDSAVIDAVSYNDRELADKMRRAFNSFYKVIKSHTGRIRFFFITGCTKLSGLSIFSAMNNLNDISADSDYAGMLGYTEEELVDSFSEHIDEKVEASGGEYESREAFISALRNYYDGYRFSDESDLRVYNPVSVGKFFSKSSIVFSDYWMQTGGANTLAITLARHADLLSIVNEMPDLTREDLLLFDIGDIAGEDVSSTSVLSLLYYAGYLTVAGTVGRALLLDFPNAEVRTAFLSGLVRTYTIRHTGTGTRVSRVMVAAEEGDTGAVISNLNAYYRLFNYEDLKGDKERHIKNLFKAFFGMLDYAVGTEIPSGKGRLDSVLITRGNSYIFEFKVDGRTAEDAFDQIIDRNYAWLFPEKARPLHLVGLDFRTERQQIVSYTHQLYGRDELECVDI